MYILFKWLNFYTDNLNFLLHLLFNLHWKKLDSDNNNSKKIPNYIYHACACDVVSVAFSVAVNMLCHVALCVPPPPSSSGLGTGNGGVGDQRDYFDSKSTAFETTSL